MNSTVYDNYFPFFFYRVLFSTKCPLVLKIMTLRQTKQNILFIHFLIFRIMNYTTTDCDLIKRVYTPSYVFFKELHATYLRYLLVPGILLNTLCLIILSQPKWSNKSTTIVFLRFLALFDILDIVLKYIRSEITYQSRHNKRDLAIVTKEFYKMFYVLMNSSISIAMWIIVLMSL